MSNESSGGFSHLNESGQPAMVDISGKLDTYRIAVAESRVYLPKPVRDQFQGKDIQTRKGGVFQTAIIAGIMAAKKTPELIPLCHQLALTGVDIDFTVGESEVEIIATVRSTDRTGVEMEALTAVSVAGLTLYDMIKAVDPAARIDDIRVLRKEGGKTGRWARP